MVSKKRPVITEQPPSSKSARGGAKADKTDSERISWHISILDVDGPFGWKDLAAPDVVWDRIHAKLCNFESMTWNEIKTKKVTTPPVNIQPNQAFHSKPFVWQAVDSPLYSSSSANNLKYDNKPAHIAMIENNRTLFV